MTTPTPAAARFGYTLALAERTLTAVLRTHLAERGVEAETWYALQLVATRGPALDRTVLAEDLAGSRALNPDTTRELLAQLEADGLISGDAKVDLTPAGEELHRSLSEFVAIPRNRLLSQFDPADIETTVRTMQAIADRAAAEVEEAATARA